MRRLSPPYEPLDAGFTLLETLAAFAILVLVLSGLFVAVSAAIGANARADFVRTAILLTEARLAELGVSEPLAPGTSEGRFANGFVWRQRATPYQGSTRPQAPDAPSLYRIDLTVTPGADANARGGSYSVVTVKPVPAFAQERGR